MDNISKETFSLFGQMLCTKTTEIPTVATKQISTCLFDRSLYEHLTRLIALLSKQCIPLLEFIFLLQKSLANRKT
jgi:hypothetical protein